MVRPITLCTGQWADLPVAELARKCSDWGYDGLELACWGDHFEVDKAIDEEDYCEKKRDLLEKNNQQVFAISNHLVGQAVLDHIDIRHKSILPPYIWGDGNPEEINRRAAEDMKNAARAAQKLGVGVVNGFTGSSIWHLLYSYPPISPEMIEDGFDLLAERFNPILDVFGECGVKFALEVHPTEIAFDLYTAERALEKLNYREEFGFNFDPSHLLWQGVDPVEFIRAFPDRIYHVHMKDAIVTLNGRSGILSSHLNFGDPHRGWDFRSLGRGGVNFEEIIRALNVIDYQGPLSIEWEDSGMDREHGAQEALEFVKQLDFEPSKVAFDAAFDKEEQVK
ncbi:MAG: sugar phosphate isomerase/epimerase [Planctomycetaceae bacterium]|nr:sugar phosphate isomerase/epimerase [Planctomycetaceae bacterium]